MALMKSIEIYNGHCFVPRRNGCVIVANHDSVCIRFKMKLLCIVLWQLVQLCMLWSSQLVWHNYNVRKQLAVSAAIWL